MNKHHQTVKKLRSYRLGIGKVIARLLFSSKESPEQNTWMVASLPMRNSADTGTLTAQAHANESQKIGGQ
jgi:hypothetical protein